MRRALAAAVLTAVALTGCGAEDGPATAGEPTPTASQSPSGSASTEPSPSPSPADDAGDDAGVDALEIEIEGGRIEPNGKRVEVTAGEPVVLEIASDRAAELHVHASPEQALQVKRGESTVRFTIETPGIVDVEEHESGIVVLRLEVR